MPKDWHAWHRPYEDPTSALSQRLATVQRLLAAALDGRPAGPIRLASACAGQARDVLGVLPHHARRADVTAALVELDPRNVVDARAEVQRCGLDGVSVIEGDAGTTDAYRAIAPVDVLLVCGVFGNVTDDDIHATVDLLPALLAPGADVLWTRYPRDAALLPTIDGWFRAAGFATVAIETGEDATGRWFGVGAHRLTAEPQPFRPGARLFTFLDDPDPTRVSPA